MTPIATKTTQWCLSMSHLVQRRCRGAMNPLVPMFIAPSVINTFRREHRCRPPFSHNYWDRSWGVGRLTHVHSSTYKTESLSKKAHIHVQHDVCQEPQAATSSSSVPHTVGIVAEPAKAVRLHPLRKGERVSVTITRIGYGGICIGDLNGRLGSDMQPEAKTLPSEDLSFPVYCPKGACPGDVVQCTVTRVRRRLVRPDGRPISPPPDGMEGLTAPRSYIEAVYTSLLAPSPKAVPSLCPHFGHHKLGGGGCGGCTMLHMPYASQLSQKDQQLRTIYAALEKNDAELPLKNILPSSDTREFRNKMEFSFGRLWLSKVKNGLEYSSTGLRDAQGNEVALGLHIPQRYDKVVDISECQIQPAVGNAILEEVRMASKEMLIEPFDTRTGSGYMRNVAIRSAINPKGEKEIMVNLITSDCDVPERLVPLGQRLQQRFDNIVCVLQNIRGVRGQHVTEEERERVLVGDRAYIEQQMCGLTFRISANSFFQTNSSQAEVLYDLVREMAHLKPTDTVLDLFCGTGTIGLSLARHVDAIYGVDIVESAIDDALVNARTNEIFNAQFMQMNLDKLKSFDDSILPNADVIVMDPPRAGLHPDLVKYLAKCEARCVVYVSCNPLSQVRDVLQLEELAPGKFRVAEIQPLDMFPNSHHVESILILERA